MVLVPAVDFRTGERWDLRRIVADAHRAGALVVLDLSHAIGAMPIDLGDADLAVGCTYKYLNGGPGAPAFGWAAPRFADHLDPPLTGWTGHARPFAMEETWTPADGVGRLRVGTPPVLSMLALDAALGALDDVPPAAIRARSLALGDAFLGALPVDVDVVTPREHHRRGAHVAVRVDGAERRCAELADRGVIVDARPPDLLRYGFAAPYVSMEDVATAVRTLADVANAR
jgi:kynureninase